MWPNDKGALVWWPKESLLLLRIFSRSAFLTLNFFKEDAKEKNPKISTRNINIRDLILKTVLECSFSPTYSALIQVHNFKSSYMKSSRPYCVEGLHGFEHFLVFIYHSSQEIGKIYSNSHMTGRFLELWCIGVLLKAKLTFSVHFWCWKKEENLKHINFVRLISLLLGRHERTAEVYRRWTE